MPILNYRTRVAPERTVGEIQKMLVAHDADAVVTRYENRIPVGISFRLPTPYGVRDFTLTVDADGVYRVLDRDPKLTASQRTHERAEWIAWRVLKDWLEAQLALIEAGMATIDKVMLPYMHISGELTVYDAYRERESAALELGAG